MNTSLRNTQEELAQYKDGSRHARELINEAWPYAAAHARSLCDDMDGSPYGEGIAVGTFYAMGGSGHMYVSPTWVEAIHEKWSKVAAEIAAATPAPPPPPPPLTRAEARAVLEAFDASGAILYDPCGRRTPEQQEVVVALRAIVSRWVKENPTAHGGAMAQDWYSEEISGALDPLRAWLREEVNT